MRRANIIFSPLDMRSASQLWPTFLAYSVSLWISDVYASRLTSRSFAFITPHAEYSSSVGVLGCKVDMNRIAYWPLDVGCDGICVKVSNEGRSLHLLRIDKSGGLRMIFRTMLGTS
jgi:hypothetical protein